MRQPFSQAIGYILGVCPRLGGFVYVHFIAVTDFSVFTSSLLPPKRCLTATRRPCELCMERCLTWAHVGMWNRRQYVHSSLSGVSIPARI